MKVLVARRHTAGCASDAMKLFATTITLALLLSLSPWSAGTFVGAAGAAEPLQDLSLMNHDE